MKNSVKYPKNRLTNTAGLSIIATRIPKNHLYGRGDMQTAKKEVFELLNRLPEDCSLEDIQYHLYVLQKIERGLKDAEEGRVYSQAEVEKIMAKWLAK